MHGTARTSMTLEGTSPCHFYFIALKSFHTYGTFGRMPEPFPCTPADAIQRESLSR